MRKGGAHSARRKKSKTNGRRGHDAGAFLLALGVFGAMALAAAYDFAHEQKPRAAASTPAPAIAREDAAPITTGTVGQAKEAIEPAALRASALIPEERLARPVIEEQITKKEDRLITGSLPAQDPIAPPPIGLKTGPQAVKKGKSTTATAKATPKNNDLFLTGQTLSPPN